MKTIPILILHGWNLSATKFISLKDELIRRGYKVYCPDLPGFGNSKLIANSWFLANYIDFVKKFLAENKLSKFILIGHSFGGRIGIKFAAQNPQGLQALVLTGAPGINPVPKFKIRFFLILARIGKLIFSLPLLSSLKILFRKFLYKIANASDYYNTNDYMLGTFKNIVKESLIPYLSQINTPTLFLWGREDRMVPLEIAKKMNKLIKNSKLGVIDNARHGVPWTHPKEFVDEIEKFLKGLN